MTIQKCPFLNLCGGCKYDFTDDNYRENKLKELPKIDFTDNAIWGKSGIRRRADFAFVDGHFGFYKKQGFKEIGVAPGTRSKFPALEIKYMA